MFWQFLWTSVTSQVQYIYYTNIYFIFKFSAWMGPITVVICISIRGSKLNIFSSLLCQLILCESSIHVPFPLTFKFWYFSFQYLWDFDVMLTGSFLLLFLLWNHQHAPVCWVLIIILEICVHFTLFLFNPPSESLEMCNSTKYMMSTLFFFGGGCSSVFISNTI